MTDNNPKKTPTGAIGLVLGGVFALAAVFFMLSGGVGVKEVNGDADLPPIASGAK